MFVYKKRGRAWPKACERERGEENENKRIKRILNKINFMVIRPYQTRHLSSVKSGKRESGDANIWMCSEGTGTFHFFLVCWTQLIIQMKEILKSHFNKIDFCKCFTGRYIHDHVRLMILSVCECVFVEHVGNILKCFYYSLMKEFKKTETKKNKK